MFDFSFSELYTFILALVGLITTYLAKRDKREEEDRNDKTKK